MGRDHTQEALDEYYTTGIDPTGGDIGPDFDPETGDILSESIEDSEDIENIEENVFEPSGRDIQFEYNVRADGHIYIPSRVLFFDTETDGLPLEDSPSAEVAPENWPHIVQLAWVETDDEGHELSFGSKIIKPEGFVIPEDATSIHGITQEYALRVGEPRKKVMRKFKQLLGRNYLNVAHNLWFDANVIAAEFKRCHVDDSHFLYRAGYCTMEGTTDLCKLPFESDNHPECMYKWPKLTELHEFLFGCSFEGAHDALNDVRATARCFWELVKRELI